jgi:hypothetical protein
VSRSPASTRTATTTSAAASTSGSRWRSRGPAVIAREITRRLLPAYTEALDKVQAHIAKRADDQANRARAAERLAALIPGSSIHDDGNHSTTVRWYATDAMIGYGHIDLSGDGTSGTFEARSLPIATVERLAAALGTSDGEEVMR